MWNIYIPKIYLVETRVFTKDTKIQGFFFLYHIPPGRLLSLLPSILPSHTGWQLGQKLEPLGKFTSTPFKAWTLVTRRDFCCSKQEMGLKMDILEKKRPKTGWVFWCFFGRWGNRKSSPKDGWRNCVKSGVFQKSKLTDRISKWEF